MKHPVTLLAASLFSLNVISIHAQPAPAYRLISIADSYIQTNGATTLQDTVSYYYNSNNRGSSLTLRSPYPTSGAIDWRANIANWKGQQLEKIDFDSSVVLLQPNTGSATLSKHVRSYDNANRVTSDIDSVRYPPLAWFPLRRILYAYNSAGSATTTITQSATANNTWNNTHREVRAYDALNHLQTLTRQLWDSVGAQWKNDSRDTLSWTGNDITFVQTELWSNTGNQWNTDTRQNLYYHAAGVLDSVRRSVLFNSAINTSWVWVYDGSGREVYFARTLDSARAYYDSSFYDAAGNRVITYETFSPLYLTTSNNHNSRTTISYTAFNQPSILTIAYYDSVSQTYRDTLQTRYHYQSYVPASVTEPPVAGPVILLYPVPAKDVLNLNIRSTDPIAADILVKDATGRALQAFSLKGNNAYSNSIDVQLLPTGIYFLELKTKTGQWSRTFCVRH